MSKMKSKPWLLEARSSESFIILVVSIAIFVDIFLYSMIVPIIPKALVDRIGVSPDDAQSWMSVLLATYGGTLLLGSPIFGYIADRTRSPKGPFIAGLIALALSTALFMLARSPALFVIARGLQGFSGAAVWVAGLALVVDTVDDSRVAEAMGYTTMGMSMGSLLGPAAGGVLYDKLGFYGAFYVPIGLIILDVILRVVLIEPSAAKQWKVMESDERSPLLQPPTSTANNSNKPNSTFQIFHLLGQRRLLVALLGGLVGALTFSAFETTLPLFLIESFHWSSSSIGLVFFIMAIPGMAGALVGKLVDRCGPRVTATVSFTIAAASLIPLRFVQHPVIAEYSLMIGLLATNGLAICAASLAAMSEVFEVVYSPESSGASDNANPVAQGYALFNMAFAGGQLVGPILGGLLKARLGWNTMTLVIALVSGVTAVASALYAGEQPPYDELVGPEEVTAA
ncbi:MFS transporter [Trichophyton mentagrophytes]|nr:MFS transporter [Trichophyton mentagrophytes]